MTIAREPATALSWAGKGLGERSRYILTHLTRRYISAYLHWRTRWADSGCTAIADRGLSAFRRRCWRWALPAAGAAGGGIGATAGAPLGAAMAAAQAGSRT